jgi:hypothetical protein
MNERLQVQAFTLVDPTEGNGAPDLYFEALTDMTIVGMSCAGSSDDAGTSTIAILDDGAATAITTTSCADADVPGTWQASGYGGSETAFTIAKDSLVLIQNTGGDAGIAINVVLWYLVGEDWR